MNFSDQIQRLIWEINRAARTKLKRRRTGADLETLQNLNLY